MVKVDDTYKRDAFENRHPIVNMFYFIVVICAAMLFIHPVFLFISFVMALIYSIMLNGSKTVKFSIFGIIPMFLMAAIFNPLFSHQGVTTLFFWPSGNPATLESFVYGIAMAGMLVSVIMWFTCFNKIMTSDKLSYLLGSIIPAMSILFSMTLRMVPRFKKQIKEISKAQQYINKGFNQGNVFQRARNGVTIMSILITWALENGVDTSNSMRARGYGLKGRSHFSLYKFERIDKIILIVSILACIMLGIGIHLNLTSVQIYPRIIMNEQTPLAIFVETSFLILASIPIILNIMEAIKWKSIQ